MSSYERTLSFRKIEEKKLTIDFLSNRQNINNNRSLSPFHFNAIDSSHRVVKRRIISIYCIYTFMRKIAYYCHSHRLRIKTCDYRCGQCVRTNFIQWKIFHVITQPFRINLQQRASGSNDNVNWNFANFSLKIDNRSLICTAMVLSHIK